MSDFRLFREESTVDWFCSVRKVLLTSFDWFVERELLTGLLREKITASR
jgi:hypothetical protein